MPTKVIQFKDATVTVHVPIFGGQVMVDIACRNFKDTGLTIDEFACLVYPSIDSLAKPLDPLPQNTSVNKPFKT